MVLMENMDLRKHRCYGQVSTLKDFSVFAQTDV